MKRVQLKPLNWTLFLALITGGFLLICTAAGCGDDDDDGSTAGTSGGAAGTTAGTGGAAAGTGGTTAGTGGEAAGTGGEAAPPATAAEKTTACQCQRDNGTLPLDRLVAECEANISDECVACVNGIAAGASCVGKASADFESCAIGCNGMILPPADDPACKELIEAAGQTSDLTDCLCETCLESFGGCTVDPTCQAILMCAVETGCDGATCMSDPVCGPLINDGLMGMETAASVGIAVEVGTCQAVCVSGGDGGMPDGGMADGG